LAQVLGAILRATEGMGGEAVMKRNTFDRCRIVRWSKVSCDRYSTMSAAYAALFWLLALVAGADPVSAASPEQAPPLAAGMARVWFLHDLVPGSTFFAPMISVNGTNIAISPEGSAFYRDYAPGTYVFSVQNCVSEPQTSQTLTVGPGQQFALHVQTDDDVAYDCILYYLSQVEPRMVSVVFRPLRYLGQN
jgi:hypothetical protein